MKKEQNMRAFAIGVSVRLISMVLLGVLLVIAQTYIVQHGSVSIDQSLNAIIHFLAVVGVGVTAVMLSKEQNTMIFISTVVLFYILLLFVSVVIYDGISKDFVYSVSGGITGLIITVLVSLAHKKRSARWHGKKYSR